ncbi:hypothetical protein [Streptomyces sp. CA-251247]|uniref:hypothetical protein n=1 Tax=Streptomyces sp. CA-251247 TaxID=3240062 RepID=UPI003D8C05AF
MTTNSQNSTPDPSASHSAVSDSGQPFMTMHTVVVLLTAMFIGAIAGGLTYLTAVPVAGAVLAGLTAAGASVPVLRSLIH